MGTIKCYRTIETEDELVRFNNNYIYVKDSSSYINDVKLNNFIYEKGCNYIHFFGNKEDAISYIE